MIRIYRKYRKRRKIERALARETFVCDRACTDVLCRRYGCPDDPAWKGDGVRR